MEEPQSSQELEFADVELFGVKVRIVVTIGRDRDLYVDIFPKNQDACKIRLVSNRMWFGLEAGRFLGVDLEELEQDGHDSRFVIAAGLVRSIIEYGLEETALVTDKGAIESKCVIPVWDAPITFSRTKRVLRATRRKATRQEYTYAPYGK